MKIKENKIFVFNSQPLSSIVFVLKRFLPQQQMVSVFTYDFGRILVKIKNHAQCERLWPGMVIACNVIKKKHVYYAEHITLLDLQGTGDYTSLSLLHHIFELAFYFVPLESPSIEIYRFLNCLTRFFYLQKLFIDDWVVVECICIAKFLSFLGFYDNVKISESLHLFDELTLLFVDFPSQQKVEFLKKKIKSIDKKELDAWILHYLKSHPSFDSFKTVVFHCSL